MSLHFGSYLQPYTSSLFWEFWLSSRAVDTRTRLHVYDVHENHLLEVHTAPASQPPLFQGLHPEPSNHDAEIEMVNRLQHAHQVFQCLEQDVIGYVREMLWQISVPSASDSHTPTSSTAATTSASSQADGLDNRSSAPSLPSSLHLSLNQLAKLKRYLIFLRFRNSSGYSSIISRLSEDDGEQIQDRTIYAEYRAHVVEMQRRYTLSAFADFLKGNDRREFSRTREGLDAADGDHSSKGSSNARYHRRDEDMKFVGFFQDIMDTYCWKMVDAELCVGVVTEERETGREEYILPEVCYGSLDVGYDEDPLSSDFFFPVTPHVAFYLLGTSTDDPPPPLANPHTVVAVAVGLESKIDVHLRNSMILQTYPTHLIFSSLKCVVCSLKSYDEFRWVNEHQDYSRLRMRCRQKYSKEELVKTLVLRERADAKNGEDASDSEDESEVQSQERRDSDMRAVWRSTTRTLRVFDLTDQVRLEGEWPVGFGTFSDVYKAQWKDPMERRERAVAVKVLRSVMVQNVKERLIRHIQAEVSAWHLLCHRHVAQFFGIVQMASTFGMVSPWYSNGIICDYLLTHPSTDRLKLLIQIASGVQHLHSLVPPIIHGDLKGGNILIDSFGCAIITDFGLSKVLDEVSQVCGGGENTPPGTACGGRGTSVFAGSTRWMAPELILALVHDTGDVGGPMTSTMTDVYAFGSVCLEVATDAVPYPHRSNDHAVILDIMTSISPRRAGSQSKVRVRSEEEYWGLVDRCWGMPPEGRPAMAECLTLLEGMAQTAQTVNGAARRRSH